MAKTDIGCCTVADEMSVDEVDVRRSTTESFKMRRSMSTARGSRYLSRHSGDRPSARPPRSSIESAGGRSIIRCPVCSKLFNNSSALAKHKLTHSDERKYTCNKCSKAFKRQDHLYVYRIYFYLVYFSAVAFSIFRILSSVLVDISEKKYTFGYTNKKSSYC